MNRFGACKKNRMKAHTLVCSMNACDCVSCVAQTSSGERECEQVNPLLAALQDHTEVSQPLVIFNTRYNCSVILHDGNGVRLWESGQQHGA